MVRTRMRTARAAAGLGRRRRGGRTGMLKVCICEGAGPARRISGALDFRPRSSVLRLTGCCEVLSPQRQSDPMNNLWRFVCFKRVQGWHRARRSLRLDAPICSSM